ncbi:hypothetical protein GGR56DRAFT_655290 [Xylariaceae sp. FL0804]|nr:hypothetical protein GGR56DRAFT_655290 [Xylariaceae sp. FL0804]
MSEKWGAEEMLGLSLICTAPEHQRKGAATAMMAPMLKIADAAGLRTYLEATPAGRPLYQRLGFRVVDAIPVDPTRLTGGKVITHPYSISVMIRDPQPAS